MERSPNPIYVGILSSHALATHHLIHLIEGNNNMVPLILTEGMNNASIFPSHACVVIVIDLWGLTPPISEYLDTFSAAIPKCTFLAMDRARNEIDVACFLRAGFAGFISHDEALYLLCPAINAVASHRVWTSPEIIHIYMNLTSQRMAARHTGAETLTARESQILELLRKRYSNKEIANLLGISESTVKFHVSNVLMKLNVNKRRDLAYREFGARPTLLSPKPVEVLRPERQKTIHRHVHKAFRIT